MYTSIPFSVWFSLLNVYIVLTIDWTKPVSSILASFSRCNRINMRQAIKKWAHIMFIDNQKKRVLMHCDTWSKTKWSIIVVVTNENVKLQSILNFQIYSWKWFYLLVWNDTYYSFMYIETLIMISLCLKDISIFLYRPI